MYNSETPKSGITTEIYSEDETLPFLKCLYKLYTDTYASILKEPWKKWREYTYCLHPNCGKCNMSRVTSSTQLLWHFQSTVQLHQPQVYSSPPLLYHTTSVSQSTSTISTSTSQNNTPQLATGNSIPSHNTPNMPSNCHTTPPTTPDKMSSNPHTTPPTTPNNTPSNPHTTTTRPTPGAISTQKHQNFLHMISNPYPTPYPTLNFGTTGQFVADEELHQLSSNTPTTLPQHSSH